MYVCAAVFDADVFDLPLFPYLFAFVWHAFDFHTFRRMLIHIFIHKYVCVCSYTNTLPLYSISDMIAFHIWCP